MRDDPHVVALVSRASGGDQDAWYEIAELVAGGLSNKAIAAELSISHTTAARHVANIMAKLGFNSRSQIAAWIANLAQGPGRTDHPGEPG